MMSKVGEYYREREEMGLDSHKTHEYMEKRERKNIMPIARKAVLEGLRERHPDADPDTWKYWTQDELWVIYQKEVLGIEPDNESFTPNYREPVLSVENPNHPDHPDYVAPTGEDIFPEPLN